MRQIICTSIIVLKRFQWMTAASFMALIPILFTLGSLFLLGSFPVRPAYGESPAINCEAHAGACSLPLDDHTVTLEITPRPIKAMQDLVFTVTITANRPPENPHIDLGMPGMKMGPNRIILKPAGKDTYEGQGVIVRCPSGRRTWFANITIPGSGEVKFIFDVIY